MSVSRPVATVARPARKSGPVRFAALARPSRLVALLAFPILLCIVPDNALFAADPTQAELEVGFARLDQDGSGALSKQEFSLMRERIRSELKSHVIGLARFDRMGDASMSRLFDKMDHNRDGKLSVAEFKTLKSSLTELLRGRV